MNLKIAGLVVLVAAAGAHAATPSQASGATPSYHHLKRVPTADTAATNPDHVLADALVYEIDSGLMVDVMIEEALIPNGFKNAPDDRAVTMISDIKKVISLVSAMSFADGSKQQACAELVRDLTTLNACLNEMVDDLAKAKAAGQWTQETNNIAHDALNTSTHLPPAMNSVNLAMLLNLQGALPSLYTEMSGMEADPAGYSLGVFNFVYDSLYLVNVTPGSLGAELGLKSLERIEEIDGKAPRDIDDAKMMIKEDAGRTIHIKVQPEFGLETTIQATVPANLQP